MRIGCNNANGMLIEDNFHYALEHNFEVFEIFFRDFFPKDILAPTRRYLRDRALGNMRLQVHAPQVPISTPEGKEILLQTIEFAKNLNSKFMTMRIIPDMKSFVDNIEEIRSIADADNVTILVENTGYKKGDIFCRHSPKDMNDIVKKTGLGITFDIGYANLLMSPRVFLKKLEGKVQNVHIHSNMGEIDTHSRMEEGNIDLRGILQVLKDRGFDGSFIFEYWHPDLWRDRNWLKTEWRSL